MCQNIIVNVSKRLKVRKKAKIRNRYNQVPHLTQDTTWESDKKTQENITHKRARRPALSQQVTTKLQRTDKKAWQTRNMNNKKDPKQLFLDPYFEYCKYSHASKRFVYLYLCIFSLTVPCIFGIGEVIKRSARFCCCLFIVYCCSHCLWGVVFGSYFVI